MSLKKLLPQGEISKEALQDLSLVFEGERLNKDKKYAEAAVKFKHALQNFPVGSSGRFMIYNKLGLVYEQLEQADSAITIYKQGAKEGTITPFTYQRLANLYLDAGDHKKVIEYCNQGLKSLKLAKISYAHELYFQIIIRNLRRKAKRQNRVVDKKIRDAN